MPTKAFRHAWRKYLAARAVRYRKPRPYLMVEVLGSRHVLAAEFNMLADYTTAPADPGVNQLVAVGNTLYFQARSALWKSDGSVNGESMVQNMRAGFASNLAELTNVNGTLFFTGTRDSQSSELWKSNGTTAGTQLLLTVPARPLPSITKLTNVGGILYFTAKTSDGVELWKSDGTTVGTSMVKDINSGSASSTPDFLTAVGSTLYFTANDGTSGVELWKSDGTALGTTRVADLNPGAASSNPKYLVNVNGKVAFAAFNTSNVVGFSDGTAAGTVTVNTSTFAHDLANVNGTLYYGLGGGLWKSNLTIAGTQLVRSGFTTSPSKLTAVGNTVYFSAGFTNSWPELGKSDGTNAGTVRVAPTIRPDLLTNANGTLYFINDNEELWRTDGTTAGSVLIRDFRSAQPISTIVNIGSTVYFATDLPQRHLWRTDGTDAGTLLISTSLNATDSSRFSHPTERNGELFLVNGLSSLLRVDMRGMINHVFDASAPIEQVSNVGGTIYFVTDDGLYKTDGTPAGSQLVKAIRTLGRFSYVGNTIYFSANDGSTGYELWRSDGTTAGTVLVRDIESGSSSSFPDAFFSFNGLLYFSAQTIQNGGELWKSDGTAAGTTMVRDIQPGAAGSYPLELVAANNAIYFSADDGTHGREFWKTDGTTAGTTFVTDLQFGPVGSNPRYTIVLNGLLYFAADNGPGGREPWAFNPLNSTSVQLADIQPALAAHSYPRSMTSVGNTVYFSAVSSLGRELWKTNGTPGSTSMVKDIFPGASSSDPNDFFDFNGMLYFSANDGTGGMELWRSNGTNLGTTPITNPDGSPGPRLVAKPFAAGNRVFFGGATPAFGSELFVLGETDYGDAPTSTTFAQNGARHLAIGPILGTIRDTSEPNGLPGVNATGDDTNGLDDEDAFSSPILLNQNGITSLSVNVSQATVHTRLSAWFDWNFDGDWNDANEHVINDLAVTNGANTLNITVPAASTMGSGVARWRISEQPGMTTSGWLATGEAEDHPFSIVREIGLTLPEANSSDIVIRKSGASIQVVDRTTSTVLESELQSNLLGLSITGSATQIDRILLDYDVGGYFVLPNGIDLNGRGGTDQFSIKGTRNTLVTSNESLTVPGQTQLSAAEGSSTTSIKYQNFEELTCTQLKSFVAQNTFDIAAKTFTISAVDPVQLAATTTLNGGRLIATSIQLPTSAVLTGRGILDGEFFSGADASIQLTGDITIGTTNSDAGVDFQGAFHIGVHTLTLLDRDQAELNATVSLGASSGGNNVPGKLAAPHGMFLFAASSASGTGTIETGTSPAQGLYNQGRIEGHSLSSPIVLTGFTNDIGSLNNVDIRGQLDVGSPTTLANYGAVTYAGQLQLDVRGNSPGTGFDQINHSSSVVLGGSLVVRLDSNFTPTPGQTLTLLKSSGALSGKFSSVQLPGTTNGSTWELGYTNNSVVLQLVGLSLSIAPVSISENSGSSTGTITRSNFDLSSELTINLSSTDTSEATVPSLITIPVGSRSANFTIQAVDDTVLDGPQSVSILANASGYGGALSNLTIADYETLSLSINAAMISENGGSAIGTVTRGNTDISSARVVNIVSGDISELTVPATVTIPAGQASVSFPLSAVDDTLLDGTQSVMISVASPGYVGDSKTIDVADFETLTITLTTASISELNGSTLARITRSNTDVATAMQVTLTSSDLTEAVLPAQVTIPAGLASATFTISAVDDTLLDGSQTVNISAAASSYQSEARVLTVLDHETLSITLDPNTVSENGGIASGTVARLNTDLDQAITITLASSDNSEAIVPASVTIPAHQASVGFTVTAVDDSLLDGSQSVNITATSIGYVSTSSSLIVQDSEALTLTVDRSSISERGGTAIGTVRRSNTDTNTTLVVRLASSDLSEATMPATVSIPAGSVSVDFTVTALDDQLLDGSQTATITASSPGYASGDMTFVVTDYETLSLTLSSPAMSEDGGAVTVTVARSNTDIGAPLTVQLQLSDTSEATVPTNVIIPAGQPSTTFVTSAIDDSIQDGTQTVVIRASAVGYVDGTRSIDVIDSVALSLIIDLTSISENGGSAIATVSRSNTNLNTAITVQLVSSDTSEAVVPAAVTIAPGQVSASFAITAIDDSILDGTQTVTISASSPGYESAARSISVLDFERLQLTISTTSISEAGGVANGRVTRTNSDIANSLTVSLTSSDTAQATLPSSVVIPANQSFVDFLIAATDDTLLDGQQTLTIVAAAQGYQTAAAALAITDSESLSLTLSKDTASENGGQIVGTVRRNNTDINLPLQVNITSSDPSEAIAPTSVVIPSQSASATFLITLIDDNLLDGTQFVTLASSADGYINASAGLSVADHETLLLSLDQTSLSEENGRVSLTVTRSNTNVQDALSVQLLSQDLTEVNIPPMVTIPANSSSATIEVVAVDDRLLDGSQLVSLQASATGYVSAAIDVTVTDRETLTIVLPRSGLNEAGESMVGRIERSNVDTQQPLTVELLSSDTGEAIVPVSVTLPAGQSFVEFTIQSIDDSLLDGPQSVTISAHHTAYVDGAVTLDIFDSERLEIELASNSMSERNGSVTATITRSNTDLDQPLTVLLQIDDASEARLPDSIIIPAGQASISFELFANDDDLLDGSQTVTVSANSTGYQSASRSLVVNDFESLQLSFGSTSVTEANGRTTATVRRSNTNIQQSLTISLLSLDTGEAQVPSSVFIPANQTSVTFNIDAVDDTLLDGLQVVTIQASADGFEPGVAELQVTDSESLSLSLPVASMSEQLGIVTAIVARGNSDISLPFTVQVTVDDPTEATVPASVTIPAGVKSVSIPVQAVDDDILDGPQPIKLTVASLGYNGQTANLIVNDSEQLFLSIDRESISENSGRAIATITRSNSNLDAPLTVTLSHSDLSEISIPAQVVIPSGQSSVQFMVDAVDDPLLDGDAIVQLLAEARGYEPGQTQLTVSDAESIQLRLLSTTMSELNGRITATVTRSNIDTQEALTVSLISSDTSELSLPAAIDIPAGQSTVSFTINAVDDQLLDGLQLVRVSVLAAGYVGDSQLITVNDDDRSFPWQNPRNPLDVNDSGQITAIDALLVINGINVQQVLTPQLPNPFDPIAYVDVNGDGFLTAIDALLVINALNQQVAGESNSDSTQLLGSDSAVAFGDWADWSSDSDWNMKRRR